MAKRKRVDNDIIHPERVDNDIIHPERVDNDIIHPEIGLKFYRSIRLDNNLDVILVSDADASMSAAAMAVRVGSFSDPLEVPGLSHLLEHLIHSGSTKFPGEREYSDFVSKHGGDDNAFTEMDHSIFYMKIATDYFEPALDRFSQMFISPLLQISSIKNEILAVHSEFKSHKEDDDHRLEQLKGSTSPQGHLFNRFTAGNKESLEKLGLEELRQHTMVLFNQHYRGGSMALSVVGRATLDVLEDWVRKLFTGIKEGPKHIPKVNPIIPIWNSDVLYVLQALSDVHRFDVSWMIPPVSDRYHFERPEIYVLELLGHEGRGSLYAFLRVQGWITSFNVSVGKSDYGCTSVGRSVTISMNLTTLGLEKKYHIVGYIYQYITILRGTTPQKWVMDDYYQIKKTRFDCFNIDGIGTKPQKFATFLAANMLDYPLKHVISGNFLPVTWNPEAINDLMKHFIPKNMRMDFVSNSVNSTEFKVEPWYHSLYYEENIPLDFKEEWNNTPQVHASLHLPSRNKFVPNDVNIRDHSGKDLSPKCLVDDASMKVWWKCDGGLSYACFNIYLKDGSDEVMNHLKAMLFIALLKDELREIIYLGTAAGLKTKLSLSHDNKVKLKVQGYREKLSLYLSEIWDKFMTFLPTIERFEIIKESLERELKNNNIDLCDQADQLLLEMLSIRYKKMLPKLKSIEFPELIIFIPDFRSQIFIEGICYGDFLEREARHISYVFQSRIPAPLPKKNLTDRTVSLLHCPKLIRNIDVKLKSETDSLAKVYYQIPCDKGQEPRVIAMLDLFTSLLKDNLFYQLRTEENLGYEVDCQPELKHGVGFGVYVRSSEYNPSHLSDRIYNGMSKFGRWLEDLSEEFFESFKTGAIAKLPENSGVSIWEQIRRKSYILDFYTKELDVLKEIKKEDLIRWYNMYFRVSSRSCRSIAICIWGCKEDRARVQEQRRHMISRMRKMQNMRMRMQKMRMQKMLMRKMWFTR